MRVARLTSRSGTRSPSADGLLEEPSDSVLIDASVGEEFLARLPGQMPPLVQPDHGHPYLIGDRPEVGSQGEPQFLGRASRRGEGVEAVVKGPAAGKGNLRQQVFLAVDVRVNGALVQAKSAGEMADGGPVIPLLSELSRGLFRQTVLGGRHGRIEPPTTSPRHRRCSRGATERSDGNMSGAWCREGLSRSEGGRCGWSWSGVGHSRRLDVPVQFEDSR